MKELQGQTRTSKVVCFLPSSSFSASPAILFFLLSTRAAATPGPESSRAGASRSCHVCKVEEQAIASKWSPWALPGHFTQQSCIPCTEPQEGRTPGCSGSPQLWALPQGHTLSAIVPLVYTCHGCILDGEPFGSPCPGARVSAW